MKFVKKFGPVFNKMMGMEVPVFNQETFLLRLIITQFSYW
jgi:hypothetical protein